MSHGLLLQHIIQHGKNPDHCMIWLHGLGANGHDLAPLHEEFQQAWGCNTRFIFPHAPERPVTVNNGCWMPAWYDIFHREINQKMDHGSINHSHQSIQAIIDQQIQQGIAAKNILLVGFSQGGAMAVYTGLRQSQPLGGIIALSCYQLFPQEVTKHPPQHLFIGHGEIDPVVPLFLGEQLRDSLKLQGHHVQWQQYPMPHSISPQEIADMRRWCEGLKT